MATRDSNDPNNPDAGDWWSQNAPPPPARQTGPVTAGDPRLSDPAYGSDPDVLAYLNSIYGPGGTALNRPDPASTWNATTETWNPLPSPPPPPPPPVPRTPDPNIGVPTSGFGAAPPPDPASTWNATTETWNPLPSPPPPPPPPVPRTPDPNIGVPTSGFGAAPPRYSSDPNAPQYTPMGTYAPPTWTGGDYVNPTVDELYASPGYQARLDSRLQGDARHFAAQGTILNGGTVKALDRSAQDYATGEYQTLRNNTYDAYVQKYKQFTDAAGMDLAARTVNANENQNTFANRTNTYLQGNARTVNDYLTNLNAQRNSELDYWSRLKDVSGSGLDAATSSR